MREKCWFFYSAQGIKRYVFVKNLGIYWVCFFLKRVCSPQQQKQKQQKYINKVDQCHLQRPFLVINPILIACVAHQQIVNGNFLKNVELEQTCEERKQESILVFFPAVVKIKVEFLWQSFVIFDEFLQ